MKQLNQLVVVLAATIWLACGSEQEATRSCLPISLSRGTDSVSFKYDTDKRLIGLDYYDRNTSATPAARETFSYQNGRVTGGTYTMSGTGTALNKVWSLEYGNNGKPAKLVSYGPSAPDYKTITEFTHGADGKLASALTRTEWSPDPGSVVTFFSGGYFYEYNGNNVSTVKYRVNAVGGIVDVLARQNLAFDDKPVFYAASESLTTINVYVNRYIPNANNNLKATIYYTSYGSSFGPGVGVDVSFDIVYDAEGRIKSNQTRFFPSIPDFGDLLFTKARYTCD